MNVSSSRIKDEPGMGCDFSLRELLFQRAIEAAENGIVIADATDSDYPIQYANPAFARKTGYDPSERNWKLAHLLEEGASAEKVRDLKDRVGRGVDCILCLEGKRSDGSRFVSELTVSPVKDQRGHITHLIGIQNDVTERFEAADALIEARDLLEEKVQERTEELKRINADLEGFTFSVSHDLRAPLRAIMGFSKVLVEDFGREVDSEMRRTLDRIHGAAARMGTIIDDLLTFSRLERKEIHRQSVDLSGIAESIAADLARRHPERNTQIGVEPGIVVEGDPTLLRMAVENLLDNAYKFTSKKDFAIIEFKKLDDHQFVVKDNGAGFEAQYGAKLFRPFERLHSASEFPGTGIGLANVRRIIERHGGRIWAEGEPEKGASFYFEL